MFADVWLAKNTGNIGRLSPIGHTMPLQFDRHWTNCLFVHTVVNTEIEFDPKKAAQNPLNHEGVTFVEAAPVLCDPYALTREDPDTVDEARFVTLGMGGAGRILLVVWTLRGENPRLISAWKANKPQRNRYEQQF